MSVKDPTEEIPPTFTPAHVEYLRKLFPGVVKPVGEPSNTMDDLIKFSSVAALVLGQSKVVDHIASLVEEGKN